MAMSPVAGRMPWPVVRVGFLSEHVLVLGGLLRVLDLTDSLSLAASDVLGLLSADVAGGWSERRGVYRREKVRRIPDANRTGARNLGNTGLDP